MSLLGRLRGHLRPGEAGERIAERHLRALGYGILERNFRCRGGEIDVVAQDGDVVVFVEVKERRSAAHGAGHEAVTAGKRQRIVRAAHVYAAARGLSEAPLRFDVVSIDPGPDGVPTVRHDRGAFDVDGR